MTTIIIIIFLIIVIRIFKNKSNDGAPRHLAELERAENMLSTVNASSDNYISDIREILKVLSVIDSRDEALIQAAAYYYRALIYSDLGEYSTARQWVAACNGISTAFNEDKEMIQDFQRRATSARHDVIDVSEAQCPHRAAVLKATDLIDNFLTEQNDNSHQDKCRKLISILQEVDSRDIAAHRVFAFFYIGACNFYLGNYTVARQSFENCLSIRPSISDSDYERIKNLQDATKEMLTNIDDMDSKEPNALYSSSREKNLGKKSYNPAEQEYLDELKQILADGEIGPRERKYLGRCAARLGLSERQAIELENSLK